MSMRRLVFFVNYVFNFAVILRVYEFLETQKFSLKLPFNFKKHT